MSGPSRRIILRAIKRGFLPVVDLPPRLLLLEGERAADTARNCRAVDAQRKVGAQRARLVVRRDSIGLDLWRASGDLDAVLGQRLESGGKIRLAAAGGLIGARKCAVRGSVVCAHQRLAVGVGNLKRAQIGAL